MEVTLNRIDDAFHFIGKGARNVEIHIDDSIKAGGKELGAGPMELVLMGMGACSSFDIITILKKQKLELEDIKVKINAVRRDEVPKVFTKVHLHFILKGNLSEDKVQRAIDLSLNKYCSVAGMVSHTAEITFGFEIEKIN